MANKALVHYYAKLLQREAITEDQIPDEYLELVKEKMATLPPLEHDPVTQTPADGQEKVI